MNRNRMITIGALVALVGFITSGPLAYLVVMIVNPQPPWTTPQSFAEHYAWIQDLPYYLGFVLIAGMLLTVAGHYLDVAGDNSMKSPMLISLALCIVFCVMITFNYVAQTTFVHNLAVHYQPANDAAIAMFSMSNPTSFCWANEMWGYGVLGLSTWSLSDYYREKGSPLRWLLISNGVVSLISPLWTIIDVNWVMSGLGIALYFAWNMLMIVTMVSIYRYSRLHGD